MTPESIEYFKIEPGGYRIVIGSPPAYEELVAYVEFAEMGCGDMVIISMDEGPDEFKIQFTPGFTFQNNVEGSTLPYDLDTFLAGINAAKARLVEMCAVPQSQHP